MRYADFPQFRPNCTPREMFRLGVFGGAYFRPIHSAVTGRDYRGKHREFGWAKRLPREALASAAADPARNRYGVLAGTTLEYWEARGWIVAQDPYGWVQWYCRFHAGRRTRDDARQVARWVAFADPEKGRFRRRLAALRRAGRDSAVLRQSLLQWGVST